MENLSSLGNRHSQHSFARTPDVKMARSKFDRSFAIKDTFDFDLLNPIFCDEILPGDSCNLSLKSFARVATQVVPVMDNMYIDYFFFFVPNRLLWANWEKFNGAQDDPGDSISFTIPQIAWNDATGIVNGSIYDKFGLPTGVDDISINALPLRAYNLIWNEWFRDQNLQDSITVNTDDGPDATTDYVLLNRGKRHDYFTSCLPWPQKGTAISLPLGTTAPVTRVANAGAWELYIAGGDTQRGSSVNLLTDAGDQLIDTVSAMSMDPQGGLIADLTNATAATINAFREAIMIQSLLELDARGGTRYVEIIRAHFNVVSPDFRLQRPEFLSGGTSTIVQHPVAQTSETNTTDQGGLTAFSTSSEMGSKIGFSKSFTEHGYVIGLAQVRADITYQRGIERMWSRSTRYDFFWPKLQEMGEQSVLNKEIYAAGTPAGTDELVFGYQERYAEYRYKPSQIKGQFRSQFAQTLDVWHLAEEYSALPVLNAAFIVSSTPIERSLAVAAAYPHILFDGWFDYKHARPMMTYGIPATLGRF